MASTQRLVPNLRRVKLRTVAFRASLQDLWDKATSIFQVKGGVRAVRAKRLSPRMANTTLYTTEQFRDFIVAEGDDDGIAAPPEDIPEEDPDDDDEDEDDGEDDDSSDDGDDHDSRRLLDEYYDRALDENVGCYLSFPCDDPDSEFTLEVVQYLSRANKNVVVPLHDDDDQPEFEYRLTVVPVEIWNEAPVALDIFSFQDSKFIDLYKLVKSEADRGRLLVWRERGPSDIEGCTQIFGGAPLAPKLPLRDKNCPVLCLLDELYDRGWTVENRIIRHFQADGVRIIDGHNLPSKRYYLQCLLVKEKIHDRGIASFQSNRVSGYYQLLLHGRSEVCSSKEYKERLQDLGEPPMLAEYTRPAKLLKIAGPPAPHPVGVLPGPAPEAPEVAPDPMEEPLPGIPAIIDGARCAYDDKSRGEPGLRLHCLHHSKCEKYRSMSLDPYGHGRRAAEFFLGAWHQGGVGISKDAHRKPPTKEAVMAYALAHS